MQIHASIVIMITAKNNTSLFTYGIAQYQSSENTFVSLCWKLFDSSNKSFDFSVRDIVTLARKFVIENSEQYITVASVTKVDKKDSSDKFYAELIFLNTLHLMFNATVTRDLNTIVTMVEATDIDYLKQEINYNTTKNPNQTTPQSLSNLNKMADEINALPEQKKIKGT
ncbi:hypothetical protein C2G38_2158815 [Gigaspora rosea]|uniref:Uncharacterized protein n=1 Tax=Gigaspora rosea TaxID=44941 RepID=A0A397VZZ1_9GLOM|nr:hypothetical protein C2G38_2158815 [Gigaspora rosea]